MSAPKHAFSVKMLEFIEIVQLAELKLEEAIATLPKDTVGGNVILMYPFAGIISARVVENVYLVRAYVTNDVGVTATEIRLGVDVIVMPVVTVSTTLSNPES